VVEEIEYDSSILLAGTLAIVEVQSRRHVHPYNIFEQFLCNAHSKSSTLAHRCAPNGAWTSSTITEDDLVLPRLQLPQLTPLIGSCLILTSILASPRGCGPNIDSCK
jgi:hypothetical protein